MTIPGLMSLHGFIATAPELTFTNNGHARFYARVGVEHFRKEADDTFTKLEPSYHDLVLFDQSAENAYTQFKPGDQFVASGYVHEFETPTSTGNQTREQFVARRIGHDCARTRYTVDRPLSQNSTQNSAPTPTQDPDRSVDRTPTSRQAVLGEQRRVPEPTPAVGL